jgi:5-formyltetrahydrofolate cyclo-ligase
VPTAGVAERLAGAGRRVLLPFVEGRDMEAADIGPPGSLVATGWGPKEPAERVAVDPEHIDVVVVPGLAFGRDGYRVGYGGGHYDRYLARIGRRAARVGIAFHEQLLDSVPHGPGDEPLHYVVTDLETCDCRDRMPDRPAGQ